MPIIPNIIPKGLMDVTPYSCMTTAQLEAEYTKVCAQYETCKAQGLKLDMSRGKPAKLQLDLVSDILTVMQTPEDTLGAVALVILDEVHIQTLCRHIPVIISLHEIAAAIPPHLRLYDPKTCDLHTLWSVAALNFDLSHIKSPRFLSDSGAKRPARQAAAESPAPPAWTYPAGC